MINLLFYAAVILVAVLLALGFMWLDKAIPRKIWVMKYNFLRKYYIHKAYKRVQEKTYGEMVLYCKRDAEQLADVYRKLYPEVKEGGENYAKETGSV